ncbi:hypothetical protein BX600DRAFT_466558 [Xylariales sp. PMI_506]|nr:hypothetical protein BX600DRAFT_466558 [Xylariales sp. PMI_506]
MPPSSSNRTVPMLNSPHTCPLCFKETTSSTALHRHISYCRRTQSQPRVRRKACQACSSAKTKCSFEVPCSRCSDKGLQCRYSHSAQPSSNQAASSGSGAPEASSSLLIPSTAILSNRGNPEESGHGQPAGEYASDSPSAHLSSNDGVIDSVHTTSHYLSDVETPFASQQVAPGLSDSGWASEMVGHHRSLEQGYSLSPWGAPPQLLLDPSLTTSILNQSIPRPLHEFPDCLTRVPKPQILDRQVARLIMQVLRTYPLMMVRRETLPPFIHPHLHRAQLPSPLVNCMGIASLFASRTVETRPYLWHMIRNETRRFLDEMNTFTNEEVLGAIQAQTIYLLMRVIDQATEPAGLNLDILRTFKLLCAQYENIERLGFDRVPDDDWQTWLYAESKRRSVIVFYLLTLIAQVNTGVSCSAAENYRAMPLCSARTIWEARSDVDWAFEYETYAVTQDEEEDLQSLGQLIDAQASSHALPDSRALDSWNTKTDSLGSLLNATIALTCSRETMEPVESGLS